MLHIVPITKKHDRKSFDCGEPGLNDFLLKRGLFSMKGDTYVVVPEPSSSEILAYFTINPNLTGIATGNHPTREFLTEMFTVEFMAVDKRHQGNGIGTELIIFLMRQVVEAAEVSNIKAFACEPLNERVRRWLHGLDFGFEEVMMDGKRMLILPVETIRQVL